jgi:hypothetical protein
MQLPSGVHLNQRQLSCLERSDGQPRGRKGKTWFEWANNQLRRSGLPIIPLPEDFKDNEDSQQQHMVSKMHKSSAAAAAAGTSGKIKTAAAARQQPLIDLLQSDRLKDPQQQQHVVNKSSAADTADKTTTAGAAQQQASLINLQVAPAATNATDISNGTFIVTGGTLFGPGINISLTGGTINGFFQVG